MSERLVNAVQDLAKVLYRLEDKISFEFALEHILECGASFPHDFSLIGWINHPFKGAIYCRVCNTKREWNVDKKEYKDSAHIYFDRRQ